MNDDNIYLLKQRINRIIEKAAQMGRYLKLDIETLAYIQKQLFKENSKLIIDMMDNKRCFVCDRTFCKESLSEFEFLTLIRAQDIIKKNTGHYSLSIKHMTNYESEI